MLHAMATYLLEPAYMADSRRISLLSRDLIEAGLNPSWPEARIAAFIRHRESMVLTARATSRGEIAGFAIMQFGDERAHLNLLAVAPRHQRRGVARRLMAWLESSALTAGTFVITLELRAANFPAIAFYSAIGYREIGRVAGYYERAEDAIRMGRDVRPGRVLTCGGGACAP
jgi:ribosomal protein S18 acetylase RimI-like enzyme